MVDQNTCYSPALYVENQPVSFVPGAGDQTQTYSLNSTALGWTGVTATAGAVTGIDSGSASCSVQGNQLVCTYQDGVGCPPGNVLGGQCPGAVYDFRFTYTEGGVPRLQERNANVPGPVPSQPYFVTTEQTGPAGQFTLYKLMYGSQLLRASFDVIVAGELTWFLSADGNVGYEGDGECGDPEGPCGNNGDGVVAVTYEGCLPQAEPAPDPPVEPTTPPLEPSSSSPSAPSPGSGEPGGGGGGGGGGLPGFGPPRRVSGTHVYERTVTSNSLPINQDIPWYPVYGSEATDDPSFLFFLPPLFTVRDGVEPTLTPWNGIAVYVNAPGDTETGVSYRSVFATPSMSLNELDTNKRVGKFSVSLKNTNTSVWSQLDNADSSKWGELRYPMNLNVSYVTENVEADTAYQLYNFDELTYPYSVYELPEFVTFVEHFKGVGNRFQGAVWSHDENQWYLEGFQLQANTKGKRVKRSRRR